MLGAGALGGVLGGLIGPKLVAVLGSNRTLYLSLIAFIAEPLAIYATSSAVLVGLGHFIAMFASVSYNIVTVSYRQRVIPDDLLGRVNSLFRFFGWGAIPLGALVGGGLVAALEVDWGREAALRAPYLFGMILMVAFLVFAILAVRMPEQKKTGH